MTSALIGHTGFVGSNLARQRKFDFQFNSRNIAEIGGHCFDLLIVSGMPAAMWIANKNPADDFAVLEALTAALKKVKAEQLVVISTVAVYPEPFGVDENSEINESAQTPYGRHRLLLEQRLANSFSNVLIVRLPGLFGSGLKKNVIYDLLNDHEVEKIDSSGMFQFYPLDRLWADVSRALTAGLRTVNLATEPTTVQEIAGEAFGIEFSNHPGTAIARFDVQSRHADIFGGRNGYLYDRRLVLDELKTFVQRERIRKAAL